MTDPRRHIQEIRQRRKESHDDVLDSLAGAIDRLEKAFPGQWHFLMEFIQNADDANSTTLSIDISRDEIQILNDGNPFDEDDVESICKVGRSSKQYTEKGEDYIGYLGVGFKSVFLISDNPQIYSDDYRFEFDRNIWENPEETPWQIYPFWIDNPSRSIVKGDYTTGFRIPLSGAVDEHRIVILYRSAIFISTVTEGTVNAAHSVDIELWEPPRKNIGREPPELFQDFVTELLQSTDSSLRN